MMEESFLSRKAVAGLSCISITSLALTTETFPGAPPARSRAARTSASRPTRAISSSGLALAALTAPFTISTGALSPPMASTMIFNSSSPFPRGYGVSVLPMR